MVELGVILCVAGFIALFWLFLDAWADRPPRPTKPLPVVRKPIPADPKELPLWVEIWVPIVTVTALFLTLGAATGFGDRDRCDY